MDLRTREIIYGILPAKLKEMRYTYLKGKMSELSENDRFFFDKNLLKILSGGGYSQFGQDNFIWKMIFDCKKKGFFLDVGANDPIKINNTYLFEEQGWNGLAFEPIRSIANQWPQKRKTECLNIAIGDIETDIEFAELNANEFSGVSSYVSNDKEDISEKYIVKQRTLTSVLKERGVNKIDFMSIDVEGYEMNVLKGIEFKDIDITCICMENNREGDDRADLELRRFLISKGYRLVGRLTIDDVFIKENYFNFNI